MSKLMKDIGPNDSEKFQKIQAFLDRQYYLWINHHFTKLSFGQKQEHLLKLMPRPRKHRSFCTKGLNVLECRQGNHLVDAVGRQGKMPPNFSSNLSGSLRNLWDDSLLFIAQSFRWL